VVDLANPFVKHCVQVATLAQSVEQETENPRVAGSNPAGGNSVQTLYAFFKISIKPKSVFSAMKALF
jgi:hypothetical protein